MKFIATVSEKVNNIPIAQGQIIFSRDDRVIYLDSDQRTAFQSIITVPTEEFRLNIQYPVNGFYFVNETAILYQYIDFHWVQITNPPQESVIFLDREKFPTKGESNVLYVDDTSIYRWNEEQNIYVEIGGNANIVWEIFE